MTYRAKNNFPFQCLAAETQVTEISAIKQKSPVKKKLSTSKDSSPLTNLETSASDAVNSLERARIQSTK